jgi:nitrogenase molybdenum-iron protein alpha/beta subunit
MAFVRQKTALIREKRVGAVGAWSGSVEAFAKEAALGDLEPRIRTYAQDLPSDVEHALELLRTIDGLAIVVHGPAGCAAALHGATKAAGPWLVTNLSERDSIMGSDAKLRKAIQEIHKTYAPKAIAVVSTPVVAINNDDIDSVTEELKDELSIPVVAVYTDGFRSKIGSTGQDVAVHSLIKHLLPLRRRAEGSHVNLLAVEESRADVEEFQGLLSQLGVESVVFPRYASVGQAQKLSEAKISVAFDPDAAEYAGSALEDLYGIPFLKVPAPFGSKGTIDWFVALGAALGKSDEAVALVERESKRVQATLEASDSFRGARVFVNLPPSQALAFGAVARELGLSIAGIKAPWAASRHARLVDELVVRAPETPILVGEGQPFEEVNLLGKLKPDLYITAGPAPIHALRIGIPVVNLDEVQILGFSGLERLARAIERALANRSLSRFLSEGADEPYDPSWLKKSVHWYIKQEVK